MMAAVHQLAEEVRRSIAKDSHISLQIGPCAERFGGFRALALNLPCP
jgi:hypothetical protein